MSARLGVPRRSCNTPPVSSRPVRNLLSLQDVWKGYGSRSVLEGVSLGISAGERIGVVGRNGDGKSTLLQIIAGTVEPDRGLVTRSGDLHLRSIAQADDLDGAATIRQELVGGKADHEWAADSRFREVLDGLLGGVSMDRFPQGLDTQIAPLSGGERRRIALAKLLLGNPELLLLDEPSEGLAPVIVEGMLAQVQRLKRDGLTILLAEQGLDFSLALADRVYVLQKGKVEFSGPSRQLRDDKALRDRLLAV